MRRVTFSSARRLRQAHGVRAKYILTCPGRVIAPYSRSSAETRDFYEIESIKHRWSARQLERQIAGNEPL
jgi:hypothetical protein